MDAHGPPPPWHALAAGGSSAIISRLFTYPPDTVKARLQVQGAGGNSLMYRNTLDAFGKIAAREGVGGFYRGFGGILLTVIPANMCYFSGYELGKRIAPAGGGLAADLTAALVAQTIAGVAFCPIDIVKQRVQTQQVLVPGTHVSPLAAVRQVYAAAGLPGFFKGYAAMNALWLPWNLIYISLYEAAKRRVYRWQLGRMRRQGADAGRHAAAAEQVSQTPDGLRVVVDPPMLQVLPLWSFPLCSALCSATASICTHPIDVVKTRLQVLSNRGGTGNGGGSMGGGSGAGGEGAAARRMTAWQVCRQLYRQEGLAGFSRGMAARVATMSTGSAVTWMTYESVKRGLARWGEARETQHHSTACTAAGATAVEEQAAAVQAGFDGGRQHGQPAWQQQQQQQEQLAAAVVAEPAAAR